MYLLRSQNCTVKNGELYVRHILPQFLKMANFFFKVYKAKAPRYALKHLYKRTWVVLVVVWGFIYLFGLFYSENKLHS